MKTLLTLRRRPADTLLFVGNGLQFLKARHELFSWFVKCERQFGFEIFEISVPSLPPGVVINDPKNLEFVLKNEGIFRKGVFFKQRSWDLFGKLSNMILIHGDLKCSLKYQEVATDYHLGNGIINADGELWKIQRKAGLEFLNKSNLAVLVDVALPKYLSNAVSKLKSTSVGDAIDLENVFHELTTQVMGRMAYDVS